MGIAALGRRGLLRIEYELGRQLGDGLVAVLRRVLIAQCGRWCAVAQPSHQLAELGGTRSDDLM